MPGKVRPIDRARIRLTGPLLDKVAYLARLAGVTASDIVNYVLGEVLTDDAQPEAQPEAPPTPTQAPPAPRQAPPAPRRGTRRTGPADVIPISRRQPARVPARMEMAELRHRAVDAREHARAARARATDACVAAARARDRAMAALQAAGLA
jgi:hypothetical protein